MVPGAVPIPRPEGTKVGRECRGSCLGRWGRGSQLALLSPAPEALEEAHSGQPLGTQGRTGNRVGLKGPKEDHGAGL